MVVRANFEPATSLKLKKTLCVSALQRFHVAHAYDKIGEVFLHMIGTNGFQIRGKEWKIYCCGLGLSSEPQKLRYNYVKNFPQKACHSCGIILLICAVVFAVVVDVS